MWIILAVWFLAICILGATGVATRLRQPMPQIDPNGMRALLQLPFILLPLFLVPLVITTHLLLFVRLRERA